MGGPGDRDKFARSVKDFNGGFRLVRCTDAIERALDERHRNIFINVYLRPPRRSLPPSFQLVKVGFIVNIDFEDRPSPLQHSLISATQHAGFHLGLTLNPSVAMFPLLKWNLSSLAHSETGCGVQEHCFLTYASIKPIPIKPLNFNPGVANLCTADILDFRKSRST